MPLLLGRLGRFVSFPSVSEKSFLPRAGSAVLDSAEHIEHHGVSPDLAASPGQEVRNTSGIRDSHHCAP